MIDVSALIGDIPTVSVTLRTFGASSVDALGEATDGAATDAAVEVVAHPMTGRALERMPEADRTREPLALYSLQELPIAGSTRPAQVLYQSRWYEIVRVEDYLALGGMWMAEARLVEVTA